MKTKKCKYCKQAFDYITIETKIECPHCLKQLTVKANLEEFEKLSSVEETGETNGTKL